MKAKKSDIPSNQSQESTDEYLLQLIKNLIDRENHLLDEQHELFSRLFCQLHAFFDLRGEIRERELDDYDFSLDTLKRDFSELKIAINHTLNKFAFKRENNYGQKKGLKGETRPIALNQHQPKEKRY